MPSRRMSHVDALKPRRRPAGHESRGEHRPLPNCEPTTCWRMHPDDYVSLMSATLPPAWLL